MRKLRAFKEFHWQELNDPVKAKAYIDVAFEEYQSGNDEALLLVLTGRNGGARGLGELRARGPHSEEHIKRNTDRAGVVY